MRVSNYILYISIFASVVVGACNRHSAADAGTQKSKDLTVKKIDTYDKLGETALLDTSMSEMLMQDTTLGNIFVKFEQTPCFGSCPTFEVIVYKNGYTTLHGKRFFDLIGHYQYQIPSGMMQEISEEIEKAKFFDMADSYPENEPTPTDLPKTKILVQSNGKVKQVVDNRYKTPDPLVELERYLNDLWISLPWEQL